MEVSQYTYFQQVGGLELDMVSGELTYGLERLAMYVQNVDNVYDLVFTEANEANGTPEVLYGDVFHQNEVQQSTYNFEHSNTDNTLKKFEMAYIKRVRDLAKGCAEAHVAHEKNLADTETHRGWIQ